MSGLTSDLLDQLDRTEQSQAEKPLHFQQRNKQAGRFKVLVSLVRSNEVKRLRQY